MRVIDLFENPIDPSQLAHEVADRMLKEYGQSAMDFNSGNCFDYSDELAGLYPHVFNSLELGNFYNHDYDKGEDAGDATGFDEKLLAHYPNWKPIKGMTWDQMFHRGFNWTGTHGWAYCKANGLSYDIECPEGVANFLDLPFFKRFIFRP